MQVMKWSVIALAVAAGTSQMAVASSQSESNGFVEDSSFNIFTRALYFNRDYRNGGGNIADASKSSGYKSGYREDSGLGLRLLYESGFTQGTVGVGVDAFSLSSVKLDGGRGRNGNGLFGSDREGRPEDTQSQVGGAIKFRISDTVLKYGNQFVASPVFSTDDSRILPETATGTYLVSNEIKGLELSAGRFTALSSQTGSSRDDINGRDDNGNKLRGLTSTNFGGANYQFTDNFSAGYHYADTEDYWKKHYINANYTIPFSDDQSLNFDLNAYRTKSQGQERGEKVDNKLWSLAGAYSFGAHTVTLAYQQSSGETPYAYGVDGNGTVWVANAVTNEFWSEDEKSAQVRYDIDMSAYGVPGLSFMARYVKGWNVTSDAGTDGKEHELGFSAKYVIQDGAAKDLSLRLALNRARADQVAANGAANFGGASGDFNEVRFFIDYPLSVL
ncbi:OprD family porin [Pseudomonas berkeleyensis]|uniref:OprD family porin n=1 Tax=Pseudomonas berkeleyensis TaxID=2726956 RepID=A0A7G5DSZ5_9PSED|nr:OprD family porin [Pseudomonas berkeleyensis]QMV64870.1 OprD family porin [Pseudomonas berkeleyensis]WSO40338.1 OprD family porin [Pseudomonas berkeleyensis]